MVEVTPSGFFDARLPDTPGSRLLTMTVFNNLVPIFSEEQQHS
jgi:hypothetical protein